MSIDLPGFADPVRESQAAFRAVLDAISRPGTLHEAGGGLTPPAPLTAASAALLLTLVDADTPLWLAPGFAAAQDWIAFHCGAGFATTPSRARFALAGSWPGLADLDPGTDEAPEDGATLILQVAALGTGRRLRLRGPGLRAPAILAVDGLPDGFVADWARNHAAGPRGIDVMLCAGGTLAALPRSVAISAA